MAIKDIPGSQAGPSQKRFPFQLNGHRNGEYFADE